MPCPARMWTLAMASGLCAMLPITAHSSSAEGARREITVTGREGSYTPDRLEVRRDDLLRVTFVADGGPHSFNVDAYRIAKRAEPGRPVRFEFYADRAGRFSYYCNLTGSDGQRHDARGELIVTP